MVDSGVDSEVSPSSPDEAEEADDAAAAAASTTASSAAETNSSEQGCHIDRVSYKSNTGPIGYSDTG